LREEEEKEEEFTELTLIEKGIIKHKISTGGGQSGAPIMIQRN